MPEAGGTIVVEVVYAEAQTQDLVRLNLPVPVTAAQAIAASGLLARHPEINLATNKIGIYGKACRPDAELREFDRVEIYRPLLADPKEVRRQRAAAGKKMKKGAAQA